MASRFERSAQVPKVASRKSSSAWPIRGSPKPVRYLLLEEGVVRLPRAKLNGSRELGQGLEELQQEVNFGAGLGLCQVKPQDGGKREGQRADPGLVGVERIAADLSASATSSAEADRPREEARAADG